MASPGSPQLFLSYSRADGDAVRDINSLLIGSQIQTFFDNQIVPGSSWPEVLENALNATQAVAVFIGPSGLGPWQRREIFFAIDRQVAEETAGRRFPVIPVILPGVDDRGLTRGFLSLNTWIDSRRLTGSTAVVAELIRAIGESRPAVGGTPLYAVCPYMGLDRFTELDHHLYFGRGESSQELFEKVQEYAMTCIVGPSGSGKSSLAFAGLIPLLRKQRSPVWEVLTFTPDKDPWISMAKAFMDFLEPEQHYGTRQKEIQNLAEVFESGRAGISPSVQDLLKKSKGSTRLLIVVDQFEELMTTSLEKFRDGFVKRLLELCEDSAVRVLLTLRADYYSKAISLNIDLTRKMARGQVTLGPMRPAEVLEAVQKPAALVGLGIEPALLDRIRDEVAGQPNSLPLLEYALVEIWKQDPSLLTYANYIKIGRVAGAIATRADRLYNALEPAEQEAARRLFLRLVQVADLSEDGSDTRYRARKSDLGEAGWSVALKFADADVRLLVVSGPIGSDQNREGAQTVEVAHEALIREWGTLKEWVKADRDFLLWRQRLALKIAEWERANRSEAGLLSGPFLIEARGWLERRRQDLNEVERAYIDVPTGDPYQIQKVEEEVREHFEYANPESASIWWALEFFHHPDELPNLEWPPLYRATLQQAHHYIALALAAVNDGTQALEYVRNISDVQAHATAVIDIAGAVATSKDPAAREQFLRVLGRTVETIRYIGDEYQRRPMIERLVRVLARSGEIQAAEQIAKRFEAPSSGFTKTLVTELSSAGNLQDALRVSREASAADSRFNLLNAVLSTIDPAQHGEIETVAREALAALPQNANRRSALESLLVTLFRMRAGSLAVAIAREQEEPEGARAAALAVCAEKLASNNPSLAAMLCQEAWQSALISPTDYLRRQLLGGIFDAWAKTGSVVSAIESIRRLSSEEDRASILIRAIRYYHLQQDPARVGDFVNEALDSLRRITNAYPRQHAANPLIETCFELGMPEDAIRIARECLEPRERSQSFLTLATNRLKNLEFDYFEEIAREALRSIADDPSDYTRDRNLADLLKLAAGSDLGSAWAWNLIQDTPNVTGRRAMLAAAVTSRTEQSLIRSIKDAGDRDAAWAAYVLKLPDLAAAKTALQAISDPGLRDQTAARLCTSLIRAGRLGDARDLVSSIASPETSTNTLLELAAGYIEQGNCYVAVQFCKRIASESATAQNSALAAVIDLLARCSEEPEARSAARDIARTIKPSTADSNDFALGLYALARTNSLKDALKYVTAAEPPNPEEHSSWLTRTFSKPVERPPRSPLDIVLSIPSSGPRKLALGALTIAYARVGDTASALEAAGHIQSIDDRVAALTEAVRASAETAFDEILAQTLEMARSLPQEYYRRRSLTELIPYVARSADPAKAVVLAREVAASDLEFVQRLVELIAFWKSPPAQADVGQMISQAFDIFSKDPNSWSRDRGIESLVNALCVAGRDKDAIRIARSVNSPATRIDLLTGAISSLAHTPSGVAAFAAAREALDQARTLPDYEQKTRIMGIVRALKSSGLAPYALTILRESSPDAGTPDTVNTAALSLAEAGFFTEAMALTETLAAAADKVQTIAALACVAAGQGLEGATEFGTKALFFAHLIPDAYPRRRAIANLAQKLDEADLYEDVFKLGALSDPYEIALATMSRVNGLLKRGDRKAASRLIQATFADAPKIANTWERDSLLQDLVKLWRQAGNEIHQLHSTDLTIPAMVKVLLSANEFEWALRIASVAQDYKLLGSLSTEFANANRYREALELADRIPLELRDETTASIAEILARNGDAPQAIDLAVDIADPSIRSTALRSLAYLQLRSGAREGALHLAQLIIHPAASTEILSAIAVSFAEGGDLVRAQAIANEAEVSLEKTSGYEDRARASARVAVAWASLHKYQRGRELAAACHLPSEKLLACSAILRYYLLATRPGLSPAIAAVPKGSL